MNIFFRPLFPVGNIIAWLGVADKSENYGIQLCGSEDEVSRLLASAKICVLTLTLPV